MSRFVKHTGYGNAAGLLASRGLLGGHSLRAPSPEGQYSSDSDSDTEEYRKVKDRINPVTGRVESPQPDPMEGMTEEEKEEEARRLLMLFNKAAKSVERFLTLLARLYPLETSRPRSRQSFTHALHLFCRDNLIQAIGVDAEGKLVSMSGLMEKSIPEQRESGSDNDEGEN